MPGLPRMPRWLLTALLPPRYADEIVGDLEEIYRQRLRTGSRARASAWAWSRTLTLIFGILVRDWSRRLAGRFTRTGPGRADRDGPWNGWVREVRVAVRALVRSPGFTVVALAFLTLGIAANAIVFSVIDAAFRPLPYPHAERLMDVRARMAGDERTRPAVYGDFQAWRAAVGSSADALVAYQTRWKLLEGIEGVHEEVLVEAVSSGFFELLGGGTVRGRIFTEADYRPDATPVALVSHGFWSRALTRDPEVLGREIRLNGVRHTVVGVVEPDFAFGATPRSVYTALPPIGIGGAEADETVDVMARLGAGARPEQLVAELGAVDVGASVESADAEGPEVPALRPIKEALYGWTWGRFGPFMGVVGFILLLVSTNLANLALLRSRNRGRDIAVRQALGAGRWRLVRQVGTEMLVLAAAANALALALASWGISALLRLDPLGVTDAAPRFDFRVVVFATAVALLAATLAALWPAVSVLRGSLQDVLHGSARQVTGSGRHQLVQRSLVVMQIAGSLVLLAGAGLLTKTNLRMQQFDSGIDGRNLLNAYVDFPEDGEEGVGEEGDALLTDQLLQRIGSMPGVASVAAMTGSGYLAWGMTETEGGITLEGSSERLPRALLAERGSYRYVSAEYFRTLGVPIVRGRSFSGPDLDGTGSPVAVLNEEAARRWWPGAGVDIVGKRFKMGPPEAETPWITVVGVVKNTRPYSVQLMGEPTAPRVQLPLSQSALGSAGFYVYLRTTGSGLDQFLPPLRAAVREVHPDLLLRNPAYLDDQRRQAIAYYSVNGHIVLGFAAFGLLLAAMGIWGVVAYRVARRTREIGLRRALGAETGQILRTVTREGATLMVVGIGAGLVLSAGLTRVLESMLFGVSPLDPAVYGAVSAFLALVVGIATYLPARRATDVDPAIALRAE